LVADASRRASNSRASCATTSNLPAFAASVSAAAIEASTASAPKFAPKAWGGDSVAFDADRESGVFLGVPKEGLEPSRGVASADFEPGFRAGGERKHLRARGCAREDAGI
jgi:hypothetical protein